MEDKLMENRLPREPGGARRKGLRYKDDADIADYLEVVKTEDEERFFAFIRRLPTDLQAQTILELPGPFQVDLIHKLDAAALAEVVQALETDDATDFTQLVVRIDRDKAEAVFELLDEDMQGVIRRLMTYDEDQAGSLMQTELFSAKAGETVQGSLRRLRRMKAQNRLEHVQFVLVTDERSKLLRVIALADLILYPSRRRYEEIVADFDAPHTVLSDAPLDEAVRAVERYDLALLPVVDRFGHLLGVITHDDVMDVIQQQSTEQMYALGKVSATEDLHEGVAKTGRHRAAWLGINLVNAVVVSIVIGFFEHALETIVALAVLMPIVANMAGTASVQTLTVMVRQIALGELTTANAVKIFLKELNISAVNGVVFGLATTAVAYVWFEAPLIAVAMGLSMLISFVSAGIIGAGTPVLLKRLDIDPAVASSVIVITLVDVIGFFSFLWIASLLVL